MVALAVAGPIAITVVKVNVKAPVRVHVEMVVPVALLVVKEGVWGHVVSDVHL